MEVPEIYDGIGKIVRDPRAWKACKISVYGTDPDVDPVGSCVGVRGSRVQNIVNELYGEKIDIVRWNEDVAVWANALAPAVVDELVIDEEAGEIDVIVSRSTLPGHRQQRTECWLASRLVGYKINISVMKKKHQH